jgi:hypothetical protein
MNLNKYLLIGTLSVIATNALAEGQNIMTSKSYVDAQDALKQDLITTGNVLFYDDNGNGVYNASDDLQVPGLVAYDSTTGELSGTKIGILDYETVLEDEEGLNMYSDAEYGNDAAQLDNFVPTVRAVANALHNIWDNMPDISGLQTKIPGYNANNSIKSVLTDTTNDGQIGKIGIATQDYLMAEGLDTIDDVSNMIPMTNAVMYELDNNWQRQIPAGTAGNVVTYSGTEGQLGSKGILQVGQDEYYAIGAYSTIFDGDQGNWPTADATKIVDGTAFAGGLALKQDIIPAHANNVADSLLTDSATDGGVHKRSIYNDTAANYNSSTQSTYIPTMGAVMSAVTSGANAALPAENANLISGQQNVTGKRSVLAPTSTAGVVNQIGLWDADGLDAAYWTYMHEYNDYSTVRQSIPTVGAVEVGLETRQARIPARATKIRNTDTTFAPSVVTNTTTAGSVGQMAIITDAKMHEDDLWWEEYANNDSLIPTLAVVGNEAERIVSDKQNKISGHANNVADSLLTDSATTGVVQKRSIYNDTAANYNSSTQSTYIPTMGAVMSAVSAGLPTGTAGNVVTYDANGVAGGSVATYDGSGTYNATNDAGKIATAAAVETKQNKKVCAGWPDGTTTPDSTHTDANCWLWEFPE